MVYRLNNPNLNLIKNPYITFVSFTVFFVLVFLDISADVVQGVSQTHLLLDILVEGLIILTASLAMVSLTLRYVEEREQRVQAFNELAVSNTKIKTRTLGNQWLAELWNV